LPMSAAESHHVRRCGLPNRMKALTHADDMAALLHDLCIEYGITPEPALEWSTRMVFSLGHAYPKRNLIRLSSWLSADQCGDTLRHELAHIALGTAGLRRPHGKAWREWATRLGAEPRATSRKPPESAPQRRRNIRYWGLECPKCGIRVMRARALGGLYHLPCGPRRGRLVKVFQDGRDAVAAWLDVKASG
jgi:predicted SprT family Zn-dependent metalloprotease